MEEAEVLKHVAIDVYQWLRESCLTKLTNQSIQLGCPGSIVYIDKSLFQHKPKVRKLPAHIPLIVSPVFFVLPLLLYPVYKVERGISGHSSTVTDSLEKRSRSKGRIAS